MRRVKYHHRFFYSRPPGLLFLRSLLGSKNSLALYWEWRQFWRTNTFIWVRARLACHFGRVWFQIYNIDPFGIHLAHSSTTKIQAARGDIRPGCWQRRCLTSHLAVVGKLKNSTSQGPSSFIETFRTKIWNPRKETAYRSNQKVKRNKAFRSPRLDRSQFHANPSHFRKFQRGIPADPPHQFGRSAPWCSRYNPDAVAWLMQGLYLMRWSWTSLYHH